jgi:hypothetical protein
MFNLRTTFTKIDTEQLQKELVAKVAAEALEELKSATPKDTGEASESWKQTADGASLTNDKDYIKQLNSGSSKQAPSMFIEAIVLRYGKPKGSSVTYE